MAVVHDYKTVWAKAVAGRMKNKATRHQSNVIQAGIYQ